MEGLEVFPPQAVIVKNGKIFVEDDPFFCDVADSDNDDDDDDYNNNTTSLNLLVNDDDDKDDEKFTAKKKGTDKDVGKTKTTESSSMLYSDSNSTQPDSTSTSEKNHYANDMNKHDHNSSENCIFDSLSKSSENIAVPNTSVDYIHHLGNGYHKEAHLFGSPRPHVPSETLHLQSCSQTDLFNSKDLWVRRVNESDYLIEKYDQSESKIANIKCLSSHRTSHHSSDSDLWIPKCSESDQWILKPKESDFWIPHSQHSSRSQEPYLSTFKPFGRDAGCSSASKQTDCPKRPLSGYQDADVWLPRVASNSPHCARLSRSFAIDEDENARGEEEDTLDDLESEKENRYRYSVKVERRSTEQEQAGFSQSGYCGDHSYVDYLPYEDQLLGLSPGRTPGKGEEFLEDVDGLRLQGLPDPGSGHNLDLYSGL